MQSKGQMWGVCFSTLADTSQGEWDPEEACQVKEIDSKKCLMFRKEAGDHLSRGVASVMIRGQSRVSSLVTEFIDARIAQGQDPWCQKEGISLPQLMKAINAMWPTASADKLFMVLGSKYLYTGANPTSYLRRDAPVMFRAPLTGAKLLRWGCVVRTRKEAERSIHKNDHLSGQRRSLS